MKEINFKIYNYKYFLLIKKDIYYIKKINEIKIIKNNNNYKYS